MKLKSAIMKVFAPAVVQYGFSLKYSSGRGCYDFYTEDKSKHIRIDIGWMRPPNLNVSFRVGRVYIDHMSFSPEFGLNDCFFYTSQEELESMLKRIADATGSKVLPYFDRLEDYYIEPTNEMYELLSHNPELKGKNYADKYGLTICETKHNFEVAERRLLQLRGDDLSRRKDNFFENLDEIMSLCAYLGEIDRLPSDHNYSKWSRWEWVTRTWENDAGEKQEYSSFVMQYDEGLFNPLANQVMSFWNYYPELNKARLNPIMLRPEKQE